MKHNEIKLHEVLLAVDRFKEAAAKMNIGRGTCFNPIRPITNKAFVTGAMDCARSGPKDNPYQRWTDFEESYNAGYKWAEGNAGFYFGYFLPEGER